MWKVLDKRISISLFAVAVILVGFIFGRLIYQDHNPKYSLTNDTTLTYSSGSYNATKTSTFRVPDRWAIVYTYSCKAHNDLKIGVHDTNGKLDPANQSITPQGENGTGRQVEPAKGVYKVLITSKDCAWEVKIGIAIRGHESFSSSTPFPKQPSNPSLATLNAAAVPILTAATNKTALLMTTGQADAAQSNALTMSPPSAFEQWRKIVEQQTNSDITNAWDQVTSLYYDGNQNLPSIANNWNTDITNTYSDIGVWQLGEVTVLVDKEGDVSSTSDQAVATTDYQAYQSDLANAQADISKL